MGDPAGAGMGSTPSGPDFVSWGPGAPAPPSPPVQGPRPPGPPQSRTPALVTAAVVALVVVVVAVATGVARWQDTHQQPAPTPVAPSSVGAQSSDRIEFVTAVGTGRLVVVSHRWTSIGNVPPASGSYLQVEVELVCLSGRIDYDPYNFQAFDQTGTLFEVSADGLDGRLLDVGRLTPGQRVRGRIAFDIPRGDTTLLMGDSTDRTVTALRIPD